MAPVYAINSVHNKQCTVQLLFLEINTISYIVNNKKVDSYEMSFNDTHSGFGNDHCPLARVYAINSARLHTPKQLPFQFLFLVITTISYIVTNQMKTENYIYTINSMDICFRLRL